MPDKQTSLAVVEPIDLPPPALTEAKEKELVQTMVVTDKKGNRFDVAINAMANRAKGQILVTKVRDLYEKMLDEVMGAGMTPDPRDMKVIAETGALINGWSEEAYGAGKLDGKTTDALERIAFAAAAGGAAGKGGNYADRMRKIQQIGKPKREKKVVQIDSDEKAQ